MQHKSPYVVNQIAINFFGDRYVVIYRNTIQFHNHRYHMYRIGTPGHTYRRCYYLKEANIGLAMSSDIGFAPPGAYGVIFDPHTGGILDCETTPNT